MEPVYLGVSWGSVNPLGKGSSRMRGPKQGDPTRLLLPVLGIGEVGRSGSGRHSPQLPLGGRGGHRESDGQQAAGRLASPCEEEEADSRPVVPLLLGGRLGRALW